jgi:rod shape-determining protein MreD
MMRQGHQVLLPASSAFIWGSMVVALVFNMMPLGRHAWQPDLLAVVLVFWNVQQPRRVGIATAFGFGLLMDVHQTALLGQHALAYTVLSFFAITIHRRILWFSLGSQTWHVLPLFVLAHAIELALRMIEGSGFPGWDIGLAMVFEAALWPLTTWVLLAPQRRAPNPDVHRPL